jgi:cytochrome c oxidase subunit 2
MAIAILLIVMVIGSIVFHFWSPWWITPLSSNWGQMDDTLYITFWVTGIVFVAINFFMAYALIRYRYNKDRKAHYEPENKKLELWLTGLTTIGVIIMLAPGLIVYEDFVHVPKNVMTVEAMAKQWQWAFRFPGKDGVLGHTNVRHVSFNNPFGMSPDDANGQDDILIKTGDLHLPVDQPVQVLLRSLDVLHDFYVPHFRVKMDAVPGIVTSLWFTPTIEGRYDLACAEYCGIGHHKMKSRVIVDDQASYLAWLAQQPTYAELSGATASVNADPLVMQGSDLAQSNGCLSCHSVDGSTSAGPTWQGLIGKTEMLEDGSKIVVDQAYFDESITSPSASIIKGFAPMMPAYELSREELDALFAFTQSLTEAKPTEASELVVDDPVKQGQQLAEANGCLSCHSVDGSASIGPTWQGLFGKTETLADGSTVVVDEQFLKESIIKPNASIIKGYTGMMPPYQFDDEQLAALVAYTQSLQSGN